MDQNSSFASIKIQDLLDKFSDSESFIKDASWRALKSESESAFVSQEALRSAMIRDIMISQMYRKFSRQKLTFDYEALMTHVIMKEHREMVMAEQEWLESNLCSFGKLDGLLIRVTYNTWCAALAVLFDGAIPHFRHHDES